MKLSELDQELSLDDIIKIIFFVFLDMSPYLKNQKNYMTESVKLTKSCKMVVALVIIIQKQVMQHL